MLTRVVVIAVVIFGVMVAVKDGRVLRTTGLTGWCAVVQRYTDSSELTLCRAGKLEGEPDLSHRGCVVVSLGQGSKYWHCPAGFDLKDLSR
jgi:hypothetical protein